jgi:hypothetical protein
MPDMSEYVTDFDFQEHRDEFQGLAR